MLQRTSGNVDTRSLYDTRYYDDATRRVDRRAVSRQGTATNPILDLRYSYDQAGNVKRLDDVASGDLSMAGQAWRQCFDYDHLRRMTRAWSTSSTSCAAPSSSTLGSVAPYADTYTLSANGNREKVVSLRRPGASVVSTTRASAYPAASAARPHAVTGVTSSGGASGTESFTYDATGNMTRRSTSASVGKSYEWDREGRVKTITDLADSAKKVEYVYDADGNRLIERDSTGSTATVTVNVGFSRITADVGSTPVQNTTTTRTYSIGGEAVVTRSVQGVRLMATDHQGTPLVAVDNNTQAFVKRRFDPWGGVLQAPASPPGWPSPRGFLDQQTDVWAGTTHLGAREYDARDGRFISVDPIADFMNPQQLNGYAYGLGNPMTFSDPNGDFIPCEGRACPGGAGTPYRPKDKRYMNEMRDNRARINMVKRAFSSWVPQSLTRRPVYGPYPYRALAQPRDWNSIGHTFLDFVGLAPVVGEPADVINGIWYFLDGDKFNGGLSIGAALPFAGWGASGGKLGKKGVDAAGTGADNVVNGTRLGEQLAKESAESVFTSSGRLSGAAINESRQIIPGTELNNKDLVRRLTSDGSDIADWGKYSTRTHQSPSGDFQVHYYMNRTTGTIDYGYDYKVKFKGAR